MRVGVVSDPLMLSPIGAIWPQRCPMRGGGGGATTPPVNVEPLPQRPPAPCTTGVLTCAVSDSIRGSRFPMTGLLIIVWDPMAYGVNPMGSDGFLCGPGGALWPYELIAFPEARFGILAAKARITIAKMQNADTAMTPPGTTWDVKIAGVLRVGVGGGDGRERGRYISMNSTSCLASSLTRSCRRGAHRRTPFRPLRFATSYVC